jgi:hypothetical protein
MTYNIPILANQVWNNTKFSFIPNHTYHMQTTGTWKDWYIKCNANGHNMFYMRPFKFLARFPKANWLTLIGFLDNPFIIGTNCTYTHKDTVSRTLHCYANDAIHFYGNNSGQVNLQITEIS